MNLQQKAVVYINTDGNGRGYLAAEGSHTLEQFVNDVARDITIRKSRSRVAQVARKSTSRRRETSAAKNGAGMDARRLPIGALGSGSDYSAFLSI